MKRNYSLKLILVYEKDDSWPALIDSLGVQNMVLVGGIDTNGDAISQVTQNSPWIYAPSQNISVPSTLGPIGNEYILKSDVALGRLFPEVRLKR